MTPEEIAELRALLAAATAGPWQYDERSGCAAVYPEKDRARWNCLSGAREDALLYSDKGAAYNGMHWDMDPQTRSNFACIVAAVNALPRLLDALEAARQERDEAQIRWRERISTHRCKVCGAKWIDCGAVFGAEHDGWSLASPACGKCCDNVAMGDQIEPTGLLARAEAAERECQEHDVRRPRLPEVRGCRVTDEYYVIDFAECRTCSHVLGEHRLSETGGPSPCAASIGIDGFGVRLLCSCEAFVAGGGDS